MTKINLHSGNYLFVEKDSEIAIHVSPKVSIEIFNKEYKYLFTTKDITEEQAESIVEFDEINGEHPDFVNGVAWLNYKRNRYEYNRVFTVKESLKSLIQANGLDINKNYLILKMI